MLIVWKVRINTKRCQEVLKTLIKRWGKEEKTLEFSEIGIVIEADDSGSKSKELVSLIRSVEKGKSLNLSMKIKELEFVLSAHVR